MVVFIDTGTDYRKALTIIERHLAKGGMNLSNSKLIELQRLSLLIEKYENRHHPMPSNPKIHAS